MYKLNKEQKQQLEAELRNLYRQEFALRQTISKQQEERDGANEELFLEILEVFDALEFLINYLAENPEPPPQFTKRLPKSLNNIQDKLLSILARRQVELIDFQENKPDFSCTQVIDSETRNDLPAQTITKIIRRGFRLQDKILRPLEVIVAKPE